MPKKDTLTLSNKLGDKFNAWLNRKFEELGKLIWKISKIVLKNTWANIKHVPQILKTIEKYFLLTDLIITFSYLFYKQAHWLLFVILAFNYFFLKAIGQSTKELMKTVKENITALKYKGISEMFDNKVKVISYKDGVIVVNSFIPYQEIEKKKTFLEHYLNIGIESIKRNEKNFKHVTIYLKNRKKFKKSYPLSKFIKIAKKKGKIPFLLGIDKNENITTVDLKDIHHFIISGGSGGGKSTLLNAIIQSLMYFNNNIAFIFVDFKRVSMNIYKKFKNSIFIKTHEIFLEYLEKIYKEMNDRYDKIEDAELEDIWQYNEQYKTDIPIIIMVVDEIANLKESPDTKVNDRIELLLRQILNMGRAAGIHVIVATQRPAGVQLSTEVRAGLLGKISFNVQEQETQKMTGVKGTQDLGQGEFKTSNMGFNGQIFKGFWTDRVKEWAVFKELKKVLSNEPEDEKNIVEIEIIEKPTKIKETKLYKTKQKMLNIYKRLKKIFLTKNNKSVEHVLEQNKLCSSKKSVIELICNLKNIENESFCSSVPENESDLTLRIEKFLDTYREGEKLPDNKDVEKEFGINKRQRLQVYEELLFKNIILKAPGNKWLYNINR